MNGRATDELLMCRLADGDQSALEELMRRWGGRIWHFIDRLCGSLGRTDDLYQDVWTRLYLYRKRYEPLRPFGPYLFRIAANCCRSAVMRRQIQSVSLADLRARVAQLASSDPAPIDALIDKEERSRLYRAIERLPWTQRAVVLTYCLFSTDYGRIAAALGKSTATVRSHMHSALKNLRATLERIALPAESEVDHGRSLHRPT